MSSVRSNRIHKNHSNAIKHSSVRSNRTLKVNILSKVKLWNFSHKLSRIEPNSKKHQNVEKVRIRELMFNSVRPDMREYSFYVLKNLRTKIFQFY